MTAGVGDLAGALVALDALNLEATSRLPFELGCAWLTKGRVYRRAKQRRAAGRCIQIAALSALGKRLYIDSNADVLSTNTPST